ncbi:hypothetical protein ES332_D05G268100v1 [Gossypium tomentosum]|uniref:Uncharacterized protein n=1 Tax=Gossypium tomentosum TaxID=34277 RepID=A0A5D2L3K6_GOSTO|nr:hypothetical protein ES332_D05G268100v1 [Gossypium tomentosum]
MSFLHCFNLGFFRFCLHYLFFSIFRFAMNCIFHFLCFFLFNLRSNFFLFFRLRFLWFFLKTSLVPNLFTSFSLRLIDFISTLNLSLDSLLLRYLFKFLIFNQLWFWYLFLKTFLFGCLSRFLLLNQL